MTIVDRERGAGGRWLSLLLSLALAGCAASQPATGARPRPLPEPKRFNSPLELAELRAEFYAAHQNQSKIIYIGVYGGGTPSWDRALYFNPKTWPPYKSVHEEAEFNEIAFEESLMHVLAIHIARLFPNSITLMIRGDKDVVLEVIKYFYAPGDKIYLIGHSQGGAVIGQAVYDLKSDNIPVQMMAEMEGFLSYLGIPSNVVQAFNFYVPSGFALCPGRDKLVAEAPAVTRVSNVPIISPWGPFTGPCAEHRNIDSDPRVWKAILQYITESAAS